MPIPKKVLDRFTQNLKRYQSILAQAKDRDVSESYTVLIVIDMLAEIWGYRKFSEITTEFAIRGTFVDVAVKVGDETRFLVEVKAVGIDLKEAHVKQATDYAANKGIEWVLLTSGVRWRAYHIHFRQPIEKTLLFDIDILAISPRDAQMAECLGVLSRESFSQDSMAAFSQQQRALSRFSIAALLLSPNMLNALRRELRVMLPRLRVEPEQLRQILTDEVLKREVVESDEAAQAGQALTKALRSARKAKESSKQESGIERPGPDDPGVSEATQNADSAPPQQTDRPSST
jgi:predicted type IV restriction endonuclease